MEWLSDNGSCYTATETRVFAQEMGFISCFTPVRSPESNGMAEAFVKTFKRDYVYIHNRPEVSHLPLERIELVRADIRDIEAMRTITRGCGHVYHLAADPNLWRRNRCKFGEVNHIGTLNVMRAALESGASRALYVSTESILTSDQSSGGAVESVRFCEEAMIGPLSKFRAEQSVFKFAEAPLKIFAQRPIRLFSANPLTDYQGVGLYL